MTLTLQTEAGLAQETGAVLVGVSALASYNDQLCAPISDLVLRNRGAGPFGLLNMVNERCGAEFEAIDDVIPETARKGFMAKYQSAAGFARDTRNVA